MQRSNKRIQVLPPHVAERIAAGEVIERPASVVKELIENSLDAGATDIMITLEDGGKSLIEIIDNGSGIQPDDLATAIQRHATSKLQSLEDLDRIHTLGFRGEALPSIAAVSDLQILSKTANSNSAYELTGSTFSPLHEKNTIAPPKPVTFGHFINSTHGTRIRVQGLFSQVPARLKFMKSPAAEVSYVREWVERLALAHPETGFKLMSQDRTLLNLRPQSESERVKSVLSDGDECPILSETIDELHSRGFLLRVHWLQGLALPHTRRLAQVVNGRAVRDRLLQQAMLSAFRQSLLPGQFPAAALFIEIQPTLVDLNVHPTKTEIRFLRSQDLFHATQKAYEALLQRHGERVIVASAVQTARNNVLWSAQDSTPTQPRLDFGFQAPHPAASSTTPTPQPLSPLQELFSTSRWAGTLFNTYILYEKGDELILIDQHAADERIRYEQLRSRLSLKPEILGSQVLLIPEVVHFPAENRSEVESRIHYLEALGFEAELFSDEAILFRAIPSEWGTLMLKPRLKSLVDRLLALSDPSQHTSLDSAVFEALASEACHSAIRAGDRLLPEQIQSLFERLQRCEHPWNCPHGRPTIVRIQKSKFEEWFSRKL